MSILRDAGLVEAICGGQCACATCHIHLSEADIGKVGCAEGVELDLLESSLEANATSRLSCQITISDDLEGLTLRVAQQEG